MNEMIDKIEYSILDESTECGICYFDKTIDILYTNENHTEKRILHLPKNPEPCKQVNFSQISISRCEGETKQSSKHNLSMVSGVYQEKMSLYDTLRNIVSSEQNLPVRIDDVIDIIGFDLDLINKSARDSIECFIGLKSMGNYVVRNGATVIIKFQFIKKILKNIMALIPCLLWCRPNSYFYSASNHRNNNYIVVFSCNANNYSALVIPEDYSGVNDNKITGTYICSSE